MTGIGSATERDPCLACANGALLAAEVQTAIWQGGDRLVVVSAVPALVCDACGERFFETETAMALDRIRGGGLVDARAIRRLDVPVFDFAAQAAAKGSVT